MTVEEATVVRTKGVTGRYDVLVGGTVVGWVWGADRRWDGWGASPVGVTGVKLVEGAGSRQAAVRQVANVDRRLFDALRARAAARDAFLSSL